MGAARLSGIGVRIWAAIPSSPQWDSVCGRAARTLRMAADSLRAGDVTPGSVGISRDSGGTYGARVMKKSSI
jgi:hypothetical protein